MSKDEVHPSLSAAIANMELLEVVGLTELFEESWCLLEYQLRGRLGSGCACDDAAESTPRHAFITHNVSTHSVAALSTRSLAAIDTITDLDRKLYAAAAKRFFRDVARVEAQTRTRVLCPRRRAAWWRQHGHVLNQS